MLFADGVFEDLESNNECTVSNPLSLFMLGNILTISNETRISLSDKLLLFISSVLSVKTNKCDVSFIIFSRFLIKGAKMLSINLNKFSIAVLRPVVNNRAGMTGL